jgi:hypothetical protein
VAEKIAPYIEYGATHVLLTNAAPIAGCPDLGKAHMSTPRAAG